MTALCMPHLPQFAAMFALLVYCFCHNLVFGSVNTSLLVDGLNASTTKPVMYLIRDVIKTKKGNKIGTTCICSDILFLE